MDHLDLRTPRRSIEGLGAYTSYQAVHKQRLRCMQHDYSIKLRSKAAFEHSEGHGLPVALCGVFLWGWIWSPG